VTYGYLLPSLGVRLFGLGVSEENIKMWKVNGRQTTEDGRQVMAKDSHKSQSNT
jgi:hypothetical protein